MCSYDQAAACTTGVLKLRHLAYTRVFVAAPLVMGIASIKFKNGDMEAMGKNLGGAVCLFLVLKIVEVIVAWAAQ